MMESNICILYFGADEELFLRMQKSYTSKLRMGLKFVKKEYSHSGLLDALIVYDPCVVHIDFSSYELKSALISEIIFIKKIKKFRSTLFAALLADSTNTKDLTFLFTSGFNLSFVKGADLENYINDSLYIGLGSCSTFLSFARASFNRIPLKVSLCSSLTKISSHNLYLETDLCVDDEQLEVELELFNGNDAKMFKVISHSQYVQYFPMLDMYCLNYPYTDAWAEITAESLQKETVETWIENYNNNFIKAQEAVVLITNNARVFGPLYTKFEEISLTIHPFEVGAIDEVTHCINNNRPNLIFWDFSLGDEKCNDKEMSELSELIAGIKSVGNFLPIVLAFNTATKSEALQKALFYRNIICIKESMLPDVIIKMVTMYSAKGRTNSAREDLCRLFGPLDKNRAVNLNFDIKIISLSELEMIFSCPYELPMFTVLRLKLPVDCFATVVPPLTSLPVFSKEKSYMAHIHGASEKNIQIIRKFVNQVIYRPIDAIDAEIVKNLIEQIEKVPEANQAVAEKTEKKAEVIPEVKSLKRQKYKGKSKL